MPSGKGAHPGTHGPTFSSVISDASKSNKPLSKDIEDRRSDYWTPKFLSVNATITKYWEGKPNKK